MAIKLGGGGGSASQINEVVTLNNDANTVTLADGRVYLKGGVFETNPSTYPLAFSGLKNVFNFSTGSQDTNSRGITWDGTHYYVVGATQDKVFKYNSAGVYQNVNFSVASQMTSPSAITWDGTYFWIVGNTNRRVYKYNSAGVYQNVNFSVASQMTSPTGITWDGTHFWLTQSGNVFKYNSAGVYQSVTFSVASEATLIQGIVWDGAAHFWVADYYNTLYKYNSSFVYQNESITLESLLNDVGWNGDGPVALMQTPKVVVVYKEAKGVVSVTDNGGQNYVRVA